MRKINYVNFIVKLWPIGNSPFAPGTICSLITSILGYFININFGSDLTICLAILSGLVGFFATNIYIKSSLNKDPQEVVIDEFSGQMIAISAAGTSPLLNITAFILFRFFDILKPGIISKAEKLDGALGIMMDDWLAGSYAAAIVFIFFLFGYINYNWYLI